MGDALVALVATALLLATALLSLSVPNAGAMSAAPVRIPAPVDVSHPPRSESPAAGPNGAEPLGGAWPTYLQNPERTGANLLERTLSSSNVSQLATIWSIKTNGSDFGSLTVVNGTVYAGSWDGHEYALNASTGHIYWKKYLGTDPNCSWGNPMGVESSAAVWNGSVYVGGGDGYWYALNAANGSVEWRLKVSDTSPSGGGFDWASPLLYNGHEYIGVASCIDSPLVRGALLMVNLTGNHTVDHRFYVVPSGELGGTIWTTPAVDPSTNTVWTTTGNDDGVHTQKYAESIVALNASNLSLIGSWQVPGVGGQDADFGSGPTLFHDGTGRPMVAATNKNGVLYALNRSNVTSNGSWKPVWQLKTGGGFAPAAFDGRVLYAAGGFVSIGGMSYGGSVWALNPRNGSVFWTAGANDFIYAGLAYANGLVVDGSGSILQVLDAANGTQLQSLAVPSSTIIDGAPSIAQGRIFWGSGDSSTTGYFLSAGLPLSATDNVTPTSGSAPLPTTIWGLPAGGMPPYNFSWSFGDGTRGYGSPVAHTFAGSGTYNVTGWVNDSSNRSAVVTLVVTVTAPLTAQLTSGARLGPAPFNVSFVATAQNGSPPYAFRWNFSDGSAVAQGATVRHEFLRPGSFLVQMTAQDSINRTAVASALVLVTAPFAMQLDTAPTSGTAPLTVNFTALASNGSAPYQFAWDFGDGSPTATGPTAQHVYSAGMFTATLRGNDRSGASRQATVVIDVASAPIPLVTSFVTDRTAGACPPALGYASFSANATGGTPPYSFAWDFGDGSAPAVGEAANHSFAVGTYTVGLTSHDSAGLSASSALRVTIPSTACPHPGTPLPPAKSTLSLASWTVVAIGAAVLVVVAAGVVVAVVRSRRRTR